VKIAKGQVVGLAQIIDLLVTHPNPHREVPTRPFTPEILCSWMVEGKLMLSLKLSNNTQVLGEVHCNGITMLHSPKTNMK
jgi:hypothetical protein